LPPATDPPHAVVITWIPSLLEFFGTNLEDFGPVS
jgi:hypothetical protein